MNTIEVLRESIIEELGGGESEYNSGRYKNALILFSKALFSICDYLIASKSLKLPEDHSERFRILQRHLPAVYLIVDKVFKTYTDTYLKPSGKESCEGLKNAIRDVGKTEKLEPKLKAIIEKV
ncbi:MAG: hypothetical protein QME12_03540 [Nanoarchaeota archaeon]|nr:hypothetical protein [Nanoarchaeota archaeon]